jgi:S-DNA-T family DNA segregation ATPase FtsK/SpoIIIE
MFNLPPMDILQAGTHESSSQAAKTEANEKLKILVSTLKSFGLSVDPVGVAVGASVALLMIMPLKGVSVRKIENRAFDIAVALGANTVWIDKYIPNYNCLGIEFLNATRQNVYLRDVLEVQEFLNHKSRLAFGAGQDMCGKPIIFDLIKKSHLLIAGTTGSGKSVFVDNLVVSLLLRNKPNEVKFIMIDSKVSGLGIYKGIPHLRFPVVTDPKKAADVLNWAVEEKKNRHNIFAEAGFRNIETYNKFAEQNGEPELPRIVIIIDEFADLSMSCKSEMEEYIYWLALKSRSAGIHLVLSTQSPDRNVISEKIKAMFPSRIAFTVSSEAESRSILDCKGAESLLAEGDCLCKFIGEHIIRLQGAWVSDVEVKNIVDYLKAQS